MSKIVTPPFQPGDSAPDFACRSSNNAHFHFNTAGGRYLLLSFFGSTHNPEVQQSLRFLYEECADQFNDTKLAFFGVSIDPRDEARIYQRLPGYRLFWDFDRKVSMQYGALHEAEQKPGEGHVYRPFSLLLDPLQRVIASVPMTPADQHNRRIRALLEALPPLDSYAGVPVHAPVLIIPRVFEPEFCRGLIAEYQRSGGYESGFMREMGGKTVGILDDKVKRRRDHMLEDPSRILAVQQRMQRHLFPQITRAFQYQVTRMERYLVACYDADSGGFFSAHRDNTTKGTAHRRFAVTINLNAEEFEGGELRFPEFGTRSYRAPTGGAVVFSCSLLHEALPVTKGTRYAFLPFLYDDAAAEIRQQNAAYLTGETYRV